MTPDQYRREGAEAMKKAVVSLMQRLIKPRQVDISREGMQLAAQGRPNVKYALRRMDLDARMSCRDLIQSIDVGEVLAEAARALGTIPEGYCFCSTNRIGDDSKAHEPECADLRAALAAMEANDDRA
jgi:hypothetical protein